MNSEAKTASALVLSILLSGCNTQTQTDESTQESVSHIEPEEEVFYLIMPRSFYDSDGDRIGDLNGVTQKLDYLQALGVTSIIMTPLYPSIYYHNYFASDFKGIDPEYGTLDDYLNMIREIHKREMKFYMDTEIQYATENHPWYKDSFKNPDSEFSDYIFYDDSLNQKPSTIIFDLRGLQSYDGNYEDIATVNLYHDDVRKYMTELYAYWVDPNQDGSFEDGVDGYRLDHMMDDLDNKGLLTNMFENFWRPLILETKKINPDIKFIAEQADWSDGGLSYFTQAGVDIVYAFGLKFSLLERDSFQKNLDWLLNNAPEKKYHFLFLDNHDTDRIASTLNGNMEVNKQKAAMLYLNKGIPFIYYGQELGMKGTTGRDYSTINSLEELGDGMDVPRREAFEWSSSIDGAGLALWYKDMKPYWNERNIKSQDGISVEEQNEAPNSLLNFYRDLFNLRRSNTAFTTGEQSVIPNDNDHVLTYARWSGDAKFILAFNFSENTSLVTLMRGALPFQPSEKGWYNVLSDGKSSFMDSNDSIEISLAQNGYMILKSK